MRDLTAQVTSSLLPFPEVTIDALGEGEIILDSVLHGKFTVGRSGLAWLACGPQLEVVHAVTGERLSAYCFSGEGDHPPNILAARDFSWLKRSGLLVGLEEVDGSMLCLYDLGLSRVVKAVVIPGRITAVEPLVSYGGASTSTQHLHQSLRWFFGIVVVVTDLGHVLLVDLCLDDLSCSQSELEASDLEVVTKSPAEIPRLREASSRQGRHLCLQLSGPSGTKATALQYLSRTNQIAVGFSDGYLQLWNMKTLRKEYHSQLEAGRVPVYAFTFQEPENDPRNCCYLWAVQSAQELEGDEVSLRLLQLAFSERKCLASGKILYEGLEYCEERYSQDVSGAAFPLRAQATNTRLLNCQTIEKFRPHPDRDDSMNEVASPDTSVSIFSWQVKAYGQGNPSTYIGVFDINRWYHAQMPDSLRAGESLHSCPYLAVWSLDPVVDMVSPRPLVDIVIHDRSFSRGLPCTWPPPEQFFNPTTYNFDATCLLNSGIVHLTCSGHQKETLSFLKKAAPCSSDFICSSYTRCLMSGLLSSRQADSHHTSPSQEEQLDAILSSAVETSSLGLITGCIKQWTAEEKPGSALNLRYILEWAWNKVIHTKEELDGICAPLFDSSSNFTDPQTLQLLQHSQRLLSNLSAIFHCLLNEAQELTQRGLVGLVNKNLVSSLISQYSQVVLWFCRTGLLPEGSAEDALQISRPFYTHAVISNYYTIRREELTRLAKGKWCADCLMIDGLVGQCGERLVNLWKRDEGGTGQYPPPTLHALLDIYLLENIDEAAKHAIVIYLLLDVMYSFPNKGGASVESFPTAFAIPIGLVKLVQGLWLLDHHDHQSSVELLLHPTTSPCHFVWQHERVLQALMCQGEHSVALRYLHVTKPPLSTTSQAKLCLSVLLHNRCLVEAWSLLRQHSSRLSMEELLGFLYESCQELGLIKELLKLPLSLTEQECFEKFLQGTGGLQNRELLMVHYLQQANYIPALQLNHTLKMNLVNERDPKLKERSNTRNSILDQYGKVLPRVQRKLAMERAKPYHHHHTTTTSHRQVTRPQPLSTVAKRSSNEKVMSRAGFISNVLTKIEEVWLGKGATPQSSPGKSPRGTETPSPCSKPCSSMRTDPFLGTPITMTARRKSRLMDLVVHPSCQTPQSLFTPLRPPGSMLAVKSTSRAPELSLLQTPQVVKRARALAASGSVFSAFTPHSILRSSLRPTPVATPSASHSVTPPLRSRESRITFTKEAESSVTEQGDVLWSNGMAVDSEISLLTRGSPLINSTLKNWTSESPEEDEDGEELEDQPHVKFMPSVSGMPSPQLRGSDSDSSSVQEFAETKPSGLLLPSGSLPGRLSLGFETSLTSVQSSDISLNYHDAPLAEDMEYHDADEDVVVVNLEAPAEQDGATESLTASAREQDEVEDVKDEITSDEDDGMVCLEKETQEEEEEEGFVFRLEGEDEMDSSSHQDRQPGQEADGTGYTEDSNQGIAEVIASDTPEDQEEQQENAFGQQSELYENAEVPVQLDQMEASEQAEASESIQESAESLEHTADSNQGIAEVIASDTPEDQEEQQENAFGQQSELYENAEVPVQLEQKEASEQAEASESIQESAESLEHTAVMEDHPENGQIDCGSGLVAASEEGKKQTQPNEKMEDGGEAFHTLQEESKSRTQGKAAESLGEKEPCQAGVQLRNPDGSGACFREAPHHHVSGSDKEESLLLAVDAVAEEGDAHPGVSASPSRATRSRRQRKQTQPQASTPRRNTRKWYSNQGIAEDIASDTPEDQEERQENAFGQQSELYENAEVPVQLEQTEASEQAEASESMQESAESLEHTADLTAFVEQHLFGDDLSSLTRSGIHDMSSNWSSSNSEPECEVPEEDKPVAEVPMLTSQKSVNSVTSSEPSGTDSHSVVSVDDSEELTSPASEEEEEEEDDIDDEEEEGSDGSEEENDDEEDEEDSGSEVEIIEEIQGNRPLASLQPGPPDALFDDQVHSHLLPGPSEQEAPELSLVPTDAELKMEGEVVMVRLGADGRIETCDEEGDGSCYTELKPSTTLLVPLELVEGHDHSLVDGAQINLTEFGMASEKDLVSEAHSSFSLMLEVEEDGEGDADADTLPMEDDQDSLQLPVQGISDDPVAQPEDILQGVNQPETPLSHGTPLEDTTELDTLDAIDELTEADTFKLSPLPELCDHLLPTGHQAAFSSQDNKTTGTQEETGEEKSPLVNKVSEDEDEVQEVAPIISESVSLDVPLVVPNEDMASRVVVAFEGMNEETPSENPLVFNIISSDLDVGPKESDAVDPVDVDPKENDPVDVGPKESDPVDVGPKESDAVDPVDVGPKESDPVDVGPKESDPVDVGPKESYAVDPVDVGPKESDPVDVGPKESDPVDVGPKESDPVMEDHPENGQIDCGSGLVAASEEGEKQTQPNEKMEEGGEAFHTLQEESKSRTRGQAAESRGEKESHVRQVFSSEIQMDPEPASEKPTPTVSRRVKKAPSTPTRMSTRKRNLSSTSSTQEESLQLAVDAVAEEGDAQPGVSASPSRATRSRRQSKQTQPQVSTRRNTRKAQSELHEEDEAEEGDEEVTMNNDTSVSVSSRSTTAAIRRTPQRATPMRTSRITRSGTAEAQHTVDTVLEEQEEAMDSRHAKEIGAKVPTPAKRQTRQSATPRRASRKIASATEDTSIVMETVAEENKQEEKEEEVFTASGKSKLRTTRIRYFEAQPAILEVEEDEQVVKKQPTSSPSRVTRTSSRTSSRMSLQVKLVPIISWSTNKSRSGASTGKPSEIDNLPEAALTNDAPTTTNSCRLTRSKLWKHPEEDLALLDTPLEVDSQTPVADALIKRLQDEEKHEGPVTNEMVRSSERKTMSVDHNILHPVAVDEDLGPEPESYSMEHSFIYSPSRRRTRGHKADPPVQSEASLPPVTAAYLAQDKADAPDDAATVPKTRRTGKSRAKPEAPMALQPVAEPELISPLPSPAETVARAQKRTGDGRALPMRMNLRHKRIMDTVFRKPVTRRKKL